ncbi:thiopeptide-type bacteriocin biosynthesis protein [Streptacidiphilus sp. BW17]|uniref:thiopeptide-type bacteriocin biosynthesis protein n=1 Tax=Streptacidiphilus sp. BW17 TaxID=3156274 RepID=UPI0035136B77
MSVPVTEEQVLAILAASTAPLDPDLADAVALYRAAGRAALSQRQTEPWVQARVRFSDWAEAETLAVSHLMPHLEALQAVKVLDSWWFLRKHPDWRLRCLPAPESGAEVTVRHLGDLLDHLTDDGHVVRWRWSRYEPETLAFGGQQAMAIAHTLFAADSREVLGLVRTGRTRPGRRELSVVLCSAMLRAALLDPIERAEVWQRVADSRSREAAQVATDQLVGMTQALHQLLHLDTRASSPVFAATKALDFAAGWTAAFRNAGAALAEADQDGRLHRGLREVLATIVRHHWNRLALSDHEQALLALASRQAEMTPYFTPAETSR